MLDTAREAIKNFTEHAKTAGVTPEVTDLIIQNHNVG